MKPPRLARIVLRLFGARDRCDEIEEDLGDLLERRAADRGRLYAWRRYWTDVLTVVAHRRDRGGRRTGDRQPADFTENTETFFFSIRVFRVIRGEHPAPPAAE